MESIDQTVFELLQTDISKKKTTCSLSLQYHEKRSTDSDKNWYTWRFFEVWSDHESNMTDRDNKKHKRLYEKHQFLISKSSYSHNLYGIWNISDMFLTLHENNKYFVSCGKDQSINYCLFLMNLYGLYLIWLSLSERWIEFEHFFEHSAAFMRPSNIIWRNRISRNRFR